MLILKKETKAGVRALPNDSKRFNVALVSGFDPSKDIASGIRTYVLGLAKASIKAGIDVKLIGIGSPGDLESYGIDFIAVQDHATTSLGFQINLLKASSSIGLSNNTIIHAQRPDDLIPFCISHPNNSKIVTTHGSHADSVRTNKGSAVGWLYDEIEGYALKRTQRILCVSRQTLSHFRSKYPDLGDKMCLIYPGIDTEIFKPTSKQEARRRIGLDEDKKVVLYAGRLVNEKRVEVILNAYKEIEKKDTKVSLVIAGSGQEKENLENIATTLGLEHAEFRPVASKSELPLLLSAADVTVIASKKEGLPTIALESLACGTQVVSTPVGIMPEIVKDGFNGFLVHDMTAFPRIIEKALVISSTLSSHCEESVKRFSWNFIIKDMMAVYHEVAEKD